MLGLCYGEAQDMRDLRLIVVCLHLVAGKCTGMEFVRENSSPSYEFLSTSRGLDSKSSDIRTSTDTAMFLAREKIF